jgi:hypothetical protein
MEYHEETNFPRGNLINICPRNWKQDPQVVGWQLFQWRHSLCMRSRSEWEEMKERLGLWLA